MPITTRDKASYILGNALAEQSFSWKLQGYLKNIERKQAIINGVSVGLTDLCKFAIDICDKVYDIEKLKLDKSSGSVDDTNKAKKAAAVFLGASNLVKLITNGTDNYLKAHHKQVEYKIKDIAPNEVMDMYAANLAIESNGSVDADGNRKLIDINLVEATRAWRTAELRANTNVRDGLKAWATWFLPDMPKHVDLVTMQTKAYERFNQVSKGYIDKLPDSGVPDETIGEFNKFMKNGIEKYRKIKNIKNDMLREEVSVSNRYLLVRGGYSLSYGKVTNDNSMRTDFSIYSAGSISTITEETINDIDNLSGLVKDFEPTNIYSNDPFEVNTTIYDSVLDDVMKEINSTYGIIKSIYKKARLLNDLDHEFKNKFKEAIKLFKSKNIEAFKTDAEYTENEVPSEQRALVLFGKKIAFEENNESTLYFNSDYIAMEENVYFPRGKEYFSSIFSILDSYLSNI